MTQPIDSMGQRSVEGFLWSGTSVGVQALGQVVVLALLARFLTAVEFGVVSAALVVVGLVKIFTDAVIGPALTQKKNLTETDQRTAFAMALYINLVAGALMWFGADVVAGFFSIGDLAPVVKALSPMFLLAATGTVANALLLRDLNFSRLSINEVVSFLTGYAAIGVVLAILGAGVWALVAAQLGYSAARSLMLLIARPHPKSLRISRASARSILYFGGGHLSARFFNYLAIQGDYMVVGRWLSAEALGFYGRAYQLALRPSVLLGNALDMVIFPVMSGVQDDMERLGRVYRRSISLVATISAPASVIGIVLGPEIVRALLGGGWEEVYLPFQVFAAGLFFRSGYKPSDSLAKATGSVYKRAWRQAAYALLVFSLALLGTRWGIPGVAVAVLVAIIVNYLMMAQLSLRELGMKWSRFGSAHTRGLVTSAAVTAILLPTATLLRGGGAGPFAVLFGSLGVLAVVGGLALWLRPQAVLGADVLWFTKRLKNRVKGRKANRTETQS